MEDRFFYLPRYSHLLLVYIHNSLIPTKVNVKRLIGNIYKFHYPVAIRTIVRYTNEKGGTSVRNQLVKSVEYSEHLDMMYMAADGSISKRRISVLQVGEVSFRAYCHLRKSKRTFTIDNILALVPVHKKERMVI